MRGLRGARAPAREPELSELVATGSKHLAVMVALAICAIGLTLSSLLYLAAQTVDRISFQREKALVSQVISQSIGEVPHNQESVTVWDDAINQLRRHPLDNEWLDNNVGVWLHEFFGLDEAYVIGPDGTPIYAMRDGRRIDPRHFASHWNDAAPLIHELRRRQMAPGKPELPQNSLSQGATDVAIFGGRPSIVSAKPIVSDTGTIVQKPGSEFVHLAVRHLDGPFLRKIGKDYRFDGLRFSWTARIQPEEAAVPWTSAAGRTVGYLVWKPFRPGSHFLERTAPLLAVAFILILLVTGLLVRKVYVRTSQLQTSRAEAQHLALHDPLTGLPNRSLFDERLEAALHTFKRDPSRQMALLYVDLDRFKRVNDSLGHPAGDQLIRELSHRLKRLLRNGDTLARLGGDEFAIIQTDVRSDDETEAVCTRLIQATAKPFTLANGQAFIGLSIGVAFAGPDGCDARELARKADIALYQSKGRGRGCYTFYQHDLVEQAHSREAVELDLQTALQAEDQLKVHYQPQFSASTGEVTGVEALVRWDHPERGPISPTSFIPVAEECGLIQVIGDWVLREACRAGRGWADLDICVNVSPLQLRTPGFATRVQAILGETGLAPKRLELEITETAYVSNAAECQPNIKLLRAIGVRIALDDFGTGYSSLRHLADFQADRVKIDRSFVHEIGGAASGDTLVRAIVDLAHVVGLKITAEGVETGDQRAFLQSIGCDALQGFLLAAPMSVGEIDLFLARNAPASAAVVSEACEPVVMNALSRSSAAGKWVRR